MTLDSRNIVDSFKGFSVERIKGILAFRRRSFATLAVNIEYDLNIATIIRNHNAFCGKEIFYIGRKRFNRQGTVGTHHYENITHFPDLESAKKEIPSKYTWIGLDNCEDSVPIQDFVWPAKPLLILGQESKGLDIIPEMRYYCSHVVGIPQTGSVRSLNVGCASAIAMYDLCQKKGWL